METQRQMTDALLMCRAAIESNDAELVSEYQLKIEPDFDEARKTLEKKIDEPKPDPFEDNSNSNVNKGSNGFRTNGFGSSDPFVANGGNTINTRTGFDDSFNAPSGFDSGFDAFGTSGFVQQKDPFGSDAFGASKPIAVTPEVGETKTLKKVLMNKSFFVFVFSLEKTISVVILLLLFMRLLARGKCLALILKNLDHHQGLNLQVQHCLPKNRRFHHQDQRHHVHFRYYKNYINVIWLVSNCILKSIKGTFTTNTTVY